MNCSSVTPDPKPAPRIKDPGLLRRAHRAYALAGCAACGQRGWAVELHHIQYRSAGGGDVWENLIGLCGTRFGCGAHEKIHNGQWKLQRIDGQVWVVDVDRGWLFELDQIGVV
jgi:hypothetical protein